MTTIRKHPGWVSVTEALAHQMATEWVYDWIYSESWYGYPDEGKPGEVEQAIRETKADKMKDAEAEVQRIIAILEKAEARRGEAAA